MKEVEWCVQTYIYRVLVYSDIAHKDIWKTNINMYIFMLKH